MSAHTCDANASKSERLYEPFMPSSTARTWASSVAVGTGRVAPTINTAAIVSAAAASAAAARKSFLRAAQAIASALPDDRRRWGKTRRFRKMVKLERNRLNLDDVEHRDKALPSTFRRLEDRRGLVQPDDQDPGGPNCGPAGGQLRRQSADHTRPPVNGIAHSERWHCRPTVGGRRRRTSDCPRRDAAPPRPAAQRQRRGVAAAA